MRTMMWALTAMICSLCLNLHANNKVATPQDFAFVLAGNYGLGDELPQDPEVFENLLISMKQAGFNTLYGVYKDWRAELCRKHQVKLMVDVLAWKPGAESDIRRPEQRRAVQEIMEKSRNDSAIWGYNLWNETMSFFAKPDGLDINQYVKMMKSWDDTHPIWVGTYRNYYANSMVEKPGVHGYYDYAWQRGFQWHFGNLMWHMQWAKSQDGVIGQWEMGSDYHKNSFKLNTSIAFGLKTILWFIGGPFDSHGNIDPNHRFFHLVKIGQDIKRLYADLGQMNMPTHVFSTPTTRWHDNKPKDLNVPWGLKSFPEEHWLQVVEGEVIAGFFNYPNGTPAVFIANHNAYQSQIISLQIRQSRERFHPQLLDRQTGAWKTLNLSSASTFQFNLSAAGGELIRFVKVEEKPEDSLN